MIIQNRDGSLVEMADTQRSEDGIATYYAEVSADTLNSQASLFDRIVNIAFDVFGARRLDVRVYEEETLDQR